MRRKQHAQQRRLNELRKRLSEDLTLALCGFLLRMNDVDDCAFILDELFKHNESMLDIAIHPGLL